MTFKQGFTSVFQPVTVVSNDHDFKVVEESGTNQSDGRFKPLSNYCIDHGKAIIHMKQ